MLYTRQDTVLWPVTAFYTNGSSKCCTQMCVNSFSTVVQNVIATRQQIRVHPIWHVSVCVKQAIVAVGVARAKGWTGWQVQSQCTRGLSGVSGNETAANHPALHALLIRTSLCFIFYPLHQIISSDILIYSHSHISLFWLLTHSSQ